MPFSKKVICGSTFILQFTTLPLEDQVIAPSQHLMLFGVIWCNNCENCGNYGDDCEQLRNRPSVAFWNKKTPPWDLQFIQLLYLSFQIRMWISWRGLNFNEINLIWKEDLDWEWWKLCQQVDGISSSSDNWIHIYLYLDFRWKKSNLNSIDANLAHKY